MADKKLAETEAGQRPTQPDPDIGDIHPDRVSSGRPDQSEHNAGGPDETHLSSMRLCVVMGIIMVLGVLTYVLAAIF
jgi:hypothetical protein